MQSSFTTFDTAANTEQPVAGANPRRRSITFAAALGTANYARPDSKGNVAGGLVFINSSGPVTLRTEDYGSIVTGPWFVFSTSAGTQSLCVIESVN